MHERMAQQRQVAPPQAPPSATFIEADNPWSEHRTTSNATVLLNMFKLQDLYRTCATCMYLHRIGPGLSVR